MRATGSLSNDANVLEAFVVDNNANIALSLRYDDVGTRLGGVVFG